MDVCCISSVTCWEVVFRTWRAAARSCAMDKEATKALRASGRRWREEVNRDLLAAVEANDTAAVYRHARTLAVTGRRPRRRVLNVPAATAPGSQEWARYLGRSGPEGSCRAEVVEYHEDNEGQRTWPGMVELHMMGGGEGPAYITVDQQCEGLEGDLRPGNRAAEHLAAVLEARDAGDPEVRRANVMRERRQFCKARRAWWVKTLGHEGARIHEDEIMDRPIENRCRGIANVRNQPGQMNGVVGNQPGHGMGTLAGRREEGAGRREANGAAGRRATRTGGGRTPSGLTTLTRRAACGTSRSGNRWRARASSRGSHYGGSTVDRRTGERCLRGVAPRKFGRWSFSTAPSWAKRWC